MPPKRRKFDSTFPAARIKKIMQLDDDVGRVASSVPVVISRAVEIFLQSLLTRAADYATSRTAKTLTVSHMKHCIEQEKQWDFLKDLTAKIADVAAHEEGEEGGAPKRGRKRRNSQSKASGSGKRKRVEEEHSDSSREDDAGSRAQSSSSLTPSMLQHVMGISVTRPPPPLVHLTTTSRAPSTSQLPTSSTYSTQGTGDGNSSSSRALPVLVTAESGPSLAALTAGLQQTRSKGEEEEEDYDA